MWETQGSGGVFIIGKRFIETNILANNSQKEAKKE
jgi:hypothetical protein